LFFLLAYFPVLKAQDSIAIPKTKTEVGIHLGSTTSMGLSYRRWFGRSGIQLTALPIKYDDYMFYSVGVSYLYSMYDSRYVRFYCYLGNNFSYERPEQYREYKTYNIGIGPAVAVGKVVRFNFMAGYGIYDVFGNIETYLAGEIGVYYNF